MSSRNGIDWDGLVEQYALVYQAAQHSLAGQAADLDKLRSRVAQLVAATAVATSFLGGLVLVDSEAGVDWLTLVAVGLFAGILGIGLWVMYPTKGWRLRPLGSQVRDNYLERDTEPASLAALYRGLAVDMEDAQEQNAPKLERRYLAFQGAVLLVGLEIIAWLAEFALRANAIGGT